MQSRWWRRSLVAAGLATAGAYATTRVRRRHRRLLEPIAPDLRASFLPWTSYLVQDLRLLGVYRRGFTTKLSPVPGTTVSRRVTDGEPAVPLLVLQPEGAGDATRPGILWMHGGALIMGTPEAEVGVVAKVAGAVGAVTVMPTYRLAPEHPFPAALDDCLAALTWMLDHADELGIDPERVVVAGGSAGGGLAAALAQRCRDEGILVTAQLLVAPMLDDRSVLVEENRSREWLLNSPVSAGMGWTAYLGHPPDPSAVPPRYAVPGRTEDLEGLPPTWLGVGSEDLFVGEGVAYGERLQASGVDCELVVGQGMYHGASLLRPDAPSSASFNASMMEFLRVHTSRVRSQG